MKQTIPQSNTAAYLAAQHLHKSGPMFRAELVAAVYFGKPQNHAQKLMAALDSGWLTEDHGMYDISKRARDHFDEIDPETPKYIGQIATSRAPNPHRPLSAKYKLNPRGTRDVPAAFVRETPSFKTVGGGA